VVRAQKTVGEAGGNPEISFVVSSDSSWANHCPKVGERGGCRRRRRRGRRGAGDELPLRLGSW